MAQAQVCIRQAAVLGPEEDGDAVFGRDGHQHFRQPGRAADDLPLTAQAGGGAHDIAELPQRFGQPGVDLHLLHHVQGGVGGHLADPGQIAPGRIHENQPAQTHVAHGAGGRPDVFGDVRLNQDDGDVRRIDFGRHQARISNRLKKYPISKAAVSGASDPCTTFFSMSVANSRRIVPSAALR